MKLTTKRNRWYFWRELFTYMIPMILIVWTIDVFASFMECPLHPEYSAPCSVNWIFAAMYFFFLLITTILAIISNKQLKNVKKKIESEFLGVAHNIEIEQRGNIKKKSEWKNSNKINDTKNAITNTLKSKRIIVNSESNLKKKSEVIKTIKKSNDTKKTSTRGNFINK